MTGGTTDKGSEDLLMNAEIDNEQFDLRILGLKVFWKNIQIMKDISKAYYGTWGLITNRTIHVFAKVDWYKK